ncbi:MULTISPECIES: chemotaxis protein CheA [unclassified Halomonas]|uniref:chemotaxis protein CheA n=1 Tax=unclassified Halomonas TaxID=2609666 RepID=UPI00288448C0|nr:MULTISPECIES: chemotaxis protein CheA [unclassified Halomonas]MDT0500535.1 chemotaxis protein CheA [Halomonas sp. PAR7]MDT0511569.1 chemotaxis protein CheA [Halomonas sp. LES1]MDT0590143.1 chemotaxis protein CheA [Halomonas sp. PAR8]
MDITDFYDTFFEEAEELLADMERHLLELDVEEPDAEQLNAIFRAAHSIKGGAGTFGFDILQKTTHLFENLLDHARRGEMTLRRDIIDNFLETKDMLNDQLDAYRNGEEPDQEAFARICQTLQRLALEEIGQGLEGAEALPLPDEAASSQSDTPPESKQTEVGGETEADIKAETEPGPADAAHEATRPATGEQQLVVSLLGVNDRDRALLVEELEQLGDVQSQQGNPQCYEIVLTTAVTPDDIEAVMCFIAEPEQVQIRLDDGEEATPPPSSAAPEAADTTLEDGAAGDEAPQDDMSDAASPAEAKSQPPAKAGSPKRGNARSNKGKSTESSSIRVSVDKVDQIINLVGELIITQSMLDQTVSEMDGMSNSNLLNGMNLLQRNARDLQEAVMSVRMIPMDFVFSRFPRVVRETSAKLGKEIELVTEGESTELDKSLTERIIDPLNHLVRNSLDHGIEPPEAREANGKPRIGKLTLSARHQGGNIIIEVCDDGAGLDRDRLLDKARQNGLPVSDTMSDDEVWQLIFAPGFSTAKAVTDVSGRGVGMDVVKRNIQGMGGQVQIMSSPGQGTTIRIVLPLTLAILDGMTIKVGEEVFILPLATVLESLQPSSADLYPMAGDDVVLKVRDEYLPVVAVHEALDVADAKTEFNETIAVIVQGEGRRYALLVDDLIGQQQVVVKNLETNYRKVPGVSAATILGDGSVALILDIPGLHRLNRAKKEARHQQRSDHKHDLYHDPERRLQTEGEAS